MTWSLIFVGHSKSETINMQINKNNKSIIYKLKNFIVNEKNRTLNFQKKSWSPFIVKISNVKKSLRSTYDN